MKRFVFFLICFYISSVNNFVLAQCSIPDQPIPPVGCFNLISPTYSTISTPGNYCLSSKMVSVKLLSVSEAATLYIKSGEVFNLEDLSFPTRGGSLTIYVLEGGSMNLTNAGEFVLNATLYNYGTVSVNPLFAFLKPFYNASKASIEFKNSLYIESGLIVNKGMMKAKEVLFDGGFPKGVCLSSGSCFQIENINTNYIDGPITLSDSTATPAFISVTGTVDFIKPLTKSKNIQVCLGNGAVIKSANWGNVKVYTKCTSTCNTPMVDPNGATKYIDCSSKQPYFLFFQPVQSGLGIPAYQWQSTSDTLGNNWKDELSQTGQNLNINGITKTTFYRRKATDENSEIYSKIFTYQVSPAFYGGHIYAPAQINVCQNSSVQLKIDSLPLSTGSIKYVWESQSGGVWYSTTNQTPIFNSIPLSEATLFRLKASSSNCSSVAYSNQVLITPLPSLKDFINAISSDQTICNGMSPKTLIGNSISATGSIYDWYASESAIGPFSKVALNTLEYTPKTLTTNSFFLRKIYSTSYCDTVLSNVVKISVLNNSPYKVLTTDDDLNNPKCGDLRYAIDQANLHSGIVDTIIFNLPSNKMNLISLKGPISIFEDISIKGPGMNSLGISNLKGSIFKANVVPVLPLKGTTLSGLTFQSSQGAIVHSMGDLTIKNCRFENNIKSDNYEGGAAIYFDNKNLLVDSSFFNNNTNNNSPEPLGMAILAKSYNGKITILNSSFDKNSGGKGANGYSGKGGALYIDGTGFKSYIDKCTFSGNSANIGGALVDGINAKSTDSIYVSNSTFNTNIASLTGGAVTGVKATFSFLNNTIFDNGADSVILTKGSAKPVGGGIYLDASKAILQNNILAGNHSTKGEDIYLVTGKVISNGGNLFGYMNNTGQVFEKSLRDIYDQIKRVDPKLLPISNNGGVTKTFIPFAGSPLIDMGIKTNGLSDQRGGKRVLGSAQDIGSTESEPCSSPLLVTRTEDTLLCGTLRYAVQVANSFEGMDTIRFSPTLVPNSLFKLKTALVINDGIMLLGSGGVTLVPDGISNLININTEKPSHFQNLTLKNSNHLLFPALQTVSSPSNLTLKKIIFENNTSASRFAAAVYSTAISTVIDSCKFLNNKISSVNPNDPSNGGAVSISIPVKTLNTIVRISNTEFINTSIINKKSGNGAALYLDINSSDADVNIYSNSFVNNRAINGGAIYLSSVTNFKNLNFSNNTFSRNIASASGGAVYVNTGNPVFVNNTIIENRVVDSTLTINPVNLKGGGIFINQGTVSLKNNLIAKNIAPLSGKDISNSYSQYNFVSNGYNFIGDTIQGKGTIQSPVWKNTDILSDSIKPKNLKLQPLAYNGGYTQNYLPILGSPLIDKGDTNILLKTDQRNIKRHVGRGVDIGSVESEVILPIVFAGKDSSFCDSIIALKATPAASGFRGYWSIKNKKANGIIIADTTKPNTNAKISGPTTFYWIVTKDLLYSDTDQVTHSLAKQVLKPAVQKITEACSDKYQIHLNIFSSELSNKYKWTMATDSLVTNSSLAGNGTITFVISNYKENKVNKLYLKTVNSASCVRLDSFNLAYYPKEKPFLSQDTLISYDDFYMAEVSSFRRNDTIIKGYWKSSNKVTHILDSIALSTYITNIPPGITRLKYTLTNFCQSSDSIIIIRRIKIDSAVAGKPKSICYDTLTLDATKTVDTLSGVWRSKDSKIGFSDSTKYNAQVHGLPQGTSILYWVVKSKIPDVDSVRITNNTPTNAHAGGNYHTCSSSAALNANLPSGSNKEIGFWKNLTPGVIISDTSNSSSGVVKLKGFPQVNLFVWNIKKENCFSRDTAKVYLPTKIMTKPDFFSGLAGDQIAGQVDANDTKAFGHQTISLFKTDWSTKGQLYSPILSDTISFGSVIFTTNPLVIGTDSLYYSLKNECGVLSDTSKIIIKTLNRPPYIKFSKVPLLIDGKATFIFSSGELDYNHNAQNVYNNDVVNPQITKLAGGSFKIEINQEELTEATTHNVKLRVCDIDTCVAALLTFPFTYIPKEVIIPAEKETPEVYNALSPNNDGKNDELIIDGLIKYPGNKLLIYNRWGNKVYEATDYHKKEPKFDGTELPDGTYYYILDKGNGDKLISGFIILKR